jgi:hypothetical protein
MLGLTEGWKVSGVDLILINKRLELGREWQQAGLCARKCAKFHDKT